MPAKHRLKNFLRESPNLYPMLRTLRFSAVVGPCRPLLVAYHRKFSHNSPVNCTPVSLVPELDPVAMAQTLERDGYTPGGTLPADHVNSVAALAGPISRGTIYNPHLTMDPIKQIAYDPKFVQVARHYFGTDPIICASRMWWSVPDQPGETTSAKAHAARFHFDVADSKSLVLFLYLTDVDLDSAPHLVILGTHKPKSMRQCCSVYLGDQAAHAAFGPRIKTLIGPKGTFFFEEQTAYHKGIPPQKPRLILGINYTLHRKPAHSID